MNHCYKSILNPLISTIAFLLAFTSFNALSTPVIENSKFVDDLDKIPKRKHKVTCNSYEITRAKDDGQSEYPINSKFTIEIDFPSGDSLYVMHVKDQIAYGLYQFTQQYYITSPEHIYIPGKSANSIADFYGITFINNINKIAPYHLTDTTGLELNYSFCRIAESNRFKTYNKWEYVWDNFGKFLMQPHPYYKNTYLTYDTESHRFVGFEDIFNANHHHDVKNLLVNHFLQQRNARLDETMNKKDFLNSVSEILNYQDWFSDDPEYKVPELSIDDFPIYDIAVIEEGILFHYPKYAVSYGHEGEYAVILPYDEIEQYLNPSIKKTLLSNNFYKSLSDNDERKDSLTLSIIKLLGEDNYEMAKSILSTADNRTRNQSILLSNIYNYLGDKGTSSRILKEALPPFTEDIIKEYWSDMFQLGLQSEDDYANTVWSAMYDIMPIGIPWGSICGIEAMQELITGLMSTEKSCARKLEFEDELFQNDTLINGADNLVAQLNHHHRRAKIFAEHGIHHQNIQELEAQLELLTDNNNFQLLAGYDITGIATLSRKIANLYNEIGEICNQTGDYGKAAQSYEECLRNCLGFPESEKIKIRGKLAAVYAKIGDKTSSEKAVSQITKDLTFLFDRAAATMNLDERNEIYELCSNWMLKGFPYVAIHSKSDSLMSKVFDATIVGKSIKLSVERNLFDIISNSMDIEVCESYNKLVGIRKNLDIAIEDLNPNQWKIDSLKREYYQLEMELSKDSKLFGDYLKNYKVTASDVLSSLEQNEAAIEFLVFPNGEQESYYCSLLSHNYESSLLIHLFDTYQNNDKQISIYNAKDKIWDKIMPYLHNMKRVYFSPAGVLSISPIEYFAEKIPFEIRRVSSSAMVIKMKSEQTRYNRHSVLFGGLDYDWDGLVPGPDKYFTDTVNERDIDELVSRGSVDYLSGTLEEVIELKQTMIQNKDYVKCYIGGTGNESNFKSLSGDSLRFLHVATHGFYLNRENSDTTTTRQNKYSYLNEEDSDLTRSGLLMAGVNYNLHNLYSNSADDGVLTSKEISRLDFSNVDLVVLSACQSGLGDIYKDGVAGLQRGFKKSGATSLLVSLWKVDDFATKQLMEYFYRYVYKGYGYNTALKKAQKKLRQFDNCKYENYTYWAGWILID